MKTSQLLLCIVAVSISACTKVDLSEDAPTCVKKVIRKIKREPVRNPPATVYEVPFNGTYYFYVSSYCCDAPSVLYDDNCDILCNPDGGWSGGGSGDCPSGVPIWAEGRLIWEDKRSE